MPLEGQLNQLVQSARVRCSGGSGPLTETATGPWPLTGTCPGQDMSGLRVFVGQSNGKP